MKRFFYGLIIAVWVIVLTGCSLWGFDHNWNMLTKSASRTRVVVALVTDNDGFAGWLESSFAKTLKENREIELIVKRTELDKVIAQLESERLLYDREEKAPGTYDLVLFDGDGFGEMKRKKLIYGPFADRLPNRRLIDVEALSYRYRDATPNEGYFLPVSRKMLTLLYSTDIFYDSPENYAEMLDTISKLKGYATYPDPRYTKEGEAFLLGLVSEAIDMEPFLRPDRNLDDFREQVRQALKPLVIIRANIMNAGLTYPTNIEQLFTDKKSYLSMSMDYMKVGEMVKEYEYPDNTTPFVLRPVGTYTTVGVIPFNSENKSGSMVTLSELLSPASQAAMIPHGMMTVYYSGTPVESVEPLKLLKLHRTVLKFSSYIDCVAPDFDRELVDIVIQTWEDMIIEK